MPCVLTGVEPAFLCVDSDQASLHRGDEFSQSERRGRGRDEPNQCRARGRFTLFFAILSSSLLLRPGYIHCWLGFKPSYGPSLSTVLDVARVNPQQMPDLLWPAEGNNRRSSLPCGKEQSQVFFALPKGTIPGLICPAERNNPRSSLACRKEQSQVFFALPKGTIPRLLWPAERNIPTSSLACRKEQSHVFFGLPKGTIPGLLWPAERNNPFEHVLTEMALPFHTFMLPQSAPSYVPNASTPVLLCKFLLFECSWIIYSWCRHNDCFLTNLPCVYYRL